MRIFHEIFAAATSHLFAEPEHPLGRTWRSLVFFWLWRKGGPS